MNNRTEIRCVHLLPSDICGCAEMRQWQMLLGSRTASAHLLSFRLRALEQ